jgi:hypothetical protein
VPKGKEKNVSEREPTANYVYQRDPDIPGAADPAIYAVAGPDVWPGSVLSQCRFKKADAQREADQLNRIYARRGIHDLRPRKL